MRACSSASEVIEGGRRGERASVPLGRQVREIGLGQGRLKTGTPPRLDGRTIDWARLEEQPSDADAWTMSALDDGVRQPQLRCAITRTNARTHDIIRANFDRSPLFAGAIEGRGPRYCPSIEDKVKRFADRDGAPDFPRARGAGRSRWSIPTAFRPRCRRTCSSDFVRSIDGLERVEIVRPGYAVEYEYVDPRRLERDARGARDLPGLFLAGQINGTTGYEEAAAQGLVAGLNAAAHALDLDRGPLRPAHELHRRDDRRSDLAGRQRALSDDDRARRISPVAARRQCHDAARARRRSRPAASRTGAATQIESHLDAARHDRAGPRPRRAAPTRSTRLMSSASSASGTSVRRDSRVWIPAELDYAAVPGLSNEMVERLTRVAARDARPGVAHPGVTPAALSALYVAASRRAAA